MDIIQGPSRGGRGVSPPDSDNDRSGRKPNRRPSRPGSRTVAQLTQEQVDRKRANDREAQRAIRQRQRDRVEALETRIRELEQSDGESHQQLLAALRANKELEEENAELRSHIEQSLHLHSPSRGGTSSGSWEDLGERNQAALSLAPGMEMVATQAGSPTLMSTRHGPLNQPGYGSRQISQWQASNPFGDPPGQGRSERPTSPGSQLGPQQYTNWTSSGDNRTRTSAIYVETGEMPIHAVDYPGASSSPTHRGSAPPYHSPPVGGAHGQPAMPLPLPLSPPGIAQYGPVQMPYVNSRQHQIQQHQHQQQRGHIPQPHLHGSSEQSPSQSAHDPHQMYSGNYPHPS